LLWISVSAPASLPLKSRSLRSAVRILLISTREASFRTWASVLIVSQAQFRTSMENATALSGSPCRTMNWVGIFSWVYGLLQISLLSESRTTVYWAPFARNSRGLAVGTDTDWQQKIHGSFSIGIGPASRFIQALCFAESFHGQFH
jgi:hypothetical protein